MFIYFIFSFTLVCRLENVFTLDFFVSMALFVFGLWMVNFEYLQFTWMLTDGIVTLPDAEDKKRSNRFNSTGFTASNVTDRSYQSLSVQVTEERHFEGAFF